MKVENPAPRTLRDMFRNPTIRSAQTADATRLAVLATQVWLHTYATEGVSQEIADYTLGQLTPTHYLAATHDASTRIWVAECDGSLIGFAVLMFGVPCPAKAQSSVELQTLYVQEHFLRQGVGRLLLRAAEEAAYRHAGTPLWLTANIHNANALAFYARQGYVKVGTAYFALGEGKHENHVLIGRDPPSVV